MGWAVEHAADCMNRYVIGADGMSVIKRLRGIDPKQPVAHFGECVIFKMLKREKEAWKTDPEVLGKWSRGIWLGRAWNSNKYFVLTSHGISRPRSIRRMPE